MNDKKKVILINGNNSNWYDQVIFIVKEKNENIMPKNLVLEAEKIIQDYMSKKYKVTNVNDINNNNRQNIAYKQNKIKSKQKLKLYNSILNVSIFCTIAFICFLLYKIYI